MNSVVVKKITIIKTLCPSLLLVYEQIASNKNNFNIQILLAIINLFETYFEFFKILFGIFDLFNLIVVQD